MITKTKISLEEALEYYEYCDIIGQERRHELKAYCKRHKIPYYFKTVGIDEVAIFFLPDRIVVAIDGSDKDRREWEGNFSPYNKIGNFFKWMLPKYKKINTKNGYHQDYYEAAMKIMAWVESKISNMDKRPIVWAGHSRGAAISRICYLESGKTDEQMNVPFASPRCMLKWRRDWYRESGIIFNIQAYFIKGDIVDNVPPAFLGWRHFNTFKTRLPHVRGFNHTSIGKAIEKAIRKRDGRTED